MGVYSKLGAGWSETWLSSSGSLLNCYLWLPADPYWRNQKIKAIGNRKMCNSFEKLKTGIICSFGHPRPERNSLCDVIMSLPSWICDHKTSHKGTRQTWSLLIPLWTVKMTYFVAYLSPFTVLVVDQTNWDCFPFSDTEISSVLTINLIPSCSWTIPNRPK